MDIFGIASMALAQSIDCPSDSEVTLNAMDKIDLILIDQSKINAHALYNSGNIVKSLNIRQTLAGN